MMAAQRSRDISAGSSITLDRDNDKNPVVALREIADDTVVLDELRDTLVKGHQRLVGNDEPDEEVVEFMVGEEEWLQRASGDAANPPTDGDPTAEPEPEADPLALGDAGDDGDPPSFADDTIGRKPDRPAGELLARLM